MSRLAGQPVPVYAPAVQETTGPNCSPHSAPYAPSCWVVALVHLMVHPLTPLQFDIDQAASDASLTHPSVVPSTCMPVLLSPGTYVALRVGWLQARACAMVLGSCTGTGLLLAHASCCTWNEGRRTWACAIDAWPCAGGVPGGMEPGGGDVGGGGQLRALPGADQASRGRGAPPSKAGAACALLGVVTGSLLNTCPPACPFKAAHTCLGGTRMGPCPCKEQISWKEWSLVASPKGLPLLAVILCSCHECIWVCARGRLRCGLLVAYMVRKRFLALGALAARAVVRLLLGQQLVFDLAHNSWAPAPFRCLHAWARKQWTCHTHTAHMLKAAAWAC